MAAVLLLIWKAADYPWSLRLKAMLPRWIPWAKKRVQCTSVCEQALQRISARTIDRLLRSKRGELRRRHYGRTKPGTLLKHQVPIRSERWDVHQAGWGEIDTVHHCGESVFGEYVLSLNFTDIASAWTESRAVMGKAQYRVTTAMEAIAEALPFALLGLDSDSGSEFLNENFIRFCHQRGLTFTRSRPYKNNDNAHIEQKNYTHVRKIFGWQRFHEDRIADLMNDLYCNELRIWMNLFQPCVKLIEKKRIGSRIKRVYDRPQTPFERLTALGMLDRAQLAHYQAISDATDPFELAAVIERKLAAIRKLASEQASQPERIPGPRPPETTGNQRRKHAARMTARFPGNIPRGATMPGPVTS